MAKKRTPKAPKTLFDKVKEFDETFATEVATATDDNIKDRLVKLTDDNRKIEDAQFEDSDLASLRAQVKTANETYTVPIKRNKLRMKLLLQTLTERGKL
jgi:hypothetical protein